MKFQILKKIKFEHKIGIIYFIIGFLWIFLSDTFFDNLLENKHILTKIHILKGVFYVFVTSLLLYYFVKRHMNKLQKAKEKAEEDEHKLEEAQSLAHIGNWELDLINNKLTWSDEIYRIFGCNPQEFAATYEAFLNFIHPDDRDFVNNSYLNHLNSKEPYDIVHKIILPNKEIKYVHERCKSDFDEQGKPLRSIGTVTDITEKKIAEEKLLRTQYSIDNITDSIFWVDKSARLVYANQAACRNLEYSLEELFSLKVFDIDPIFPKERWEEHWEEILLRGSFIIETVHRTKNGRQYPVEVTTNKVEFGGVQYNCAIARDITERIQAEQAILEKQQVFQALVENSPDIIARYDINCQRTYVNPQYLKTAQISQQELIATSPVQLSPLPKDSAGILQDLLRRVIDTAIPEAADLRWPKEDNIEHWYNVHAFPEFGRNGDVVSVMTISRDITERKQTEEAIETERKRMEVFLSSQNTGLSLINPDMTIAWVNQKTREMFPDRGEPVGMPCHDFYESRATVCDGCGTLKAFKNGKICECEQFVSTNGRWYYIVSQPIKDEIGHVVNVLEGITDITERKHAENKLAQNEALLNTLVDTIPDLVWLKDEKGVYLHCNKRFENFFGASKNEIIGKTDYDFVDKELADFFRQKDKAAIAAGKPSMNEEQVTFANDGHIELLETIKTPIYAKDKQIIGVLGIAHDVTKRKQAELLLKEKNEEFKAQNEEYKQLNIELQKAKEKAEESDRLKSAFLANMSHEIRTPMNGILGFADLLKKPKLKGDKQQEYISLIENSGLRMLNIINDIINISKIESRVIEINISESNINEQIEYLYTFFKPEVEQKGLQLIIKNLLPTKEAIIKTDREKIYAILTNLVKNAIKFCDKGIIEFGYEKKGTDLQFFVKDTGVGIRQDQKELIFERFRQGSESLTRNYEGAGLGLSISKAYVEMLGGKIWVESEEGKGSIFYFTIPYINELLEKQITENIISDLKEKKQINNLKILIVEDDETTEKLITTIVEQYSSQILKAGSGIEAVQICRNNPDINLVLMDIKVPELNGLEATKQIRQFNKEVIIFAQTAYALSGDREKAIEAGCNDYISKPFGQDQLAVLIERYFSK
ncbi:MAG: PAS domain S-box protein [Bacteroidia bacterium]|nr:PAS domain S-box protein [Bacteroidia bacterium]